MEDVELNSLIPKKNNNNNNNNNNRRRGNFNNNNNRNRNQNQNYGRRRNNYNNNNNNNRNYRGNQYGNRQNNNNNNNFRQPRQKLYRVKIENLHYSVGEEELTKAFGRIGEYKRCKIEWDQSGRSNEQGFIDYLNLDDAERAVDEFNGQKFEGQVITAQLVDIPQKNFNNIKRNNGFRRRY